MDIDPVGGESVMDIDPVGGDGGVKAGASGSRPSAMRRTRGRWRRNPRSIDPMARLSELTPRAGPAGPLEGVDKPPTFSIYPPILASGMGVDQLPGFRFDPPRRKSGLGLDQPPNFRFETSGAVLDPFKAGAVLDPFKVGAVLAKESCTSPILHVDMKTVIAGSRECKEIEERLKEMMLKQAKDLEEEAARGICDSEEHTEEEEAEFRACKLKNAATYRYIATTKPAFIYKPPSDTIEEHLTAEEMERQADISGWPVCSQASHFATIALDWYNTSKKKHKFEVAKVLLSKCFTDVDYKTYAHVNFTATPTPHSHSPKRLFFAELMLVPDLLACKDAEPMRVLSVSTIDDSCFGGCHEMVRDIKGPIKKDMDYERCHACSARIKHPRGDQFVAGHNRTRMPYVSALPWTYKP